MRPFCCICLAMCFLCGCAKKAEVKKAPAAPPVAKEKSSAQTLVDGMTGRTAIKSGRKARNTIMAVSKKQDDDLNEIMGNE